MINVSVIVPIYNAEKHLKECLDSLKEQTLTEIEFILVDDGSTDKSSEICKSYLSDNRFSYIRKENSGHVASYLKGFESSKGKYIGFVDADDYVDKNMFLLMYQKANQNNSDLVITNRYDIEDNGTILPSPILDKFNENLHGTFTVNDIYKIYDLTLPPFNGFHMPNSRWNKLFKREIFQKNIKYLNTNPRTFEDRFITPACIFSSKSIYVLNDKLYYYRHSPNTVHVRPKHNLYEILCSLADVQKEMLLENNLYIKYKNNYELAQLNYLSLFVDRNIIGNKKLKLKMLYAKQIIKDKRYQELISLHKKDMNGKKGKLLKLCYLFKSPLLLSLISYLGKN